MDRYKWPTERQPMRRVNQVEGIESLANVFKAEFGNISKQIAKCMKPKEEVHEVINMRNDDMQVEYPPEDVNYTEGESPIYPGGPTHLEYEEMQRKIANN